jgi:glutamate synthase (NADPH/NADH) small chain
VRFITNVEVGKDYPVDKLRAALRRHRALHRRHQAQRPAHPRSRVGGIHFAMDFLRGNTKHLLDAEAAEWSVLSAAGKDVIVIGGGDTGTDCVGTSLRHGCRSLAQFEIRARRPDERAADNPWPQWPRVYKHGLRPGRGGGRFGADPRTFQISTTKFVGDEHGHVKELHTVKVNMNFSNGRMSFEPIPGSEEVWPAQLVLLAMGFRGPEDFLDRPVGRGTRRRSNVAGRPRQVPHQRRGHLRRRRHAPRPEPGRLGDQRRPRRRARGGSLADGRDEFAVGQQRRRIKEVVRHSRSLSACLSCISLLRRSPLFHVHETLR